MVVNNIAFFLFKSLNSIALQVCTSNYTDSTGNIYLMDPYHAIRRVMEGVRDPLPLLPPPILPRHPIMLCVTRSSPPLPPPAISSRDLLPILQRPARGYGGTPAAMLPVPPCPKLLGSTGRRAPAT
jgi:hypothetical protein